LVLKSKIEEVARANTESLKAIQAEIQTYNNNISLIVGQQQTLQENIMKLNEKFEGRKLVRR